MSGFSLHLQGARQYECIPSVESFIGEDASGRFGLLTGHERFMTPLVFGLARFRQAGGGWEYLALPGALLHFTGHDLYINTRRYIRDADYGRISAALTEQLLKEERVLAGLKQNLRQLEEAMLQNLLDIERGFL